MNKILYTADLDLNSKQLESIYPDRAYVRHGGRQSHLVNHKDGTASEVTSIIWKEVTVTKVWVDCIENSDDVEVRKSYALHLLMDDDKQLDISLTAKQYNRFSEYKYTKPAADLLTKILRKDGNGLLIRRLPSTRKYSFRAHRKVAEMIDKNSKKCGLSAGEYIERCCARTSPRLALDAEEKTILREFCRGRQDFQFFWNTMSAWREGKSRQEISNAVIMGDNFLPLRKRLAAILQDWDRIIGILLNRQIQDKA